MGRLLSPHLQLRITMNQTMLYKCPGSQEMHGGHFDYTIVDADEEGAIDKALAEGWHLTTPEAKAAHEAALAAATAAKEAEKTEQTAKQENAPPTRAELEQAASDLGILFDGRTKDKKLSELIAAATAPKAE
jgi:hypothetical protein